MDTLIDLLLGSNIPYITYAVPFFFLLIGVELLIGWLTRRQFYRLNDSINDLSCGIIDQIVGVFLQVVLFAGYLFLFAHFRIFEMAEWSAAGKWAAAIGLLFGVDFCFYWFHRIAHEYAAPWAAHVVHHQSEEYNLAVALRQSAFESCFAWVFYLPLAVIGFPPTWYLAVKAINLIYQFWVHTEAVDRLGPLELVMNTPSHHRVHHARNAKYLDKNYAGMFIIWDRLFGTFQVEDERPVYGITRPLQSWNPIWANLHYWVYLFDLARKAPRWRDKLKLWFMPLGWVPPGVEPPPPFQEVTRESVKKFDPKAPLWLALYALFQFILVLVTAVYLMHLDDQGVPRWQLVLPAAMLVWSLVNLGAMFEKHRWVIGSELLRLLAVLAAVSIYAWDQTSFNVVTAMTAAWFGVSLVWFWSQRAVLLRPRRIAVSETRSPAQSPLAVGPRS